MSKTFSAHITGEYGSDDAEVIMEHKSNRPEKQRAEVAVCLANLIEYAHREHGFTKEEVSAWPAWDL